MVAKKTLASHLNTSEVSATMISRFDAPRAMRNSSIEDNEDDNLTIKTRRQHAFRHA
jgi:hypothetical protein